jgi:hypothetical protein
MYSEKEIHPGDLVLLKNKEFPGHRYHLFLTIKEIESNRTSLQNPIDITDFEGEFGLCISRTTKIYYGFEVCYTTWSNGLTGWILGNNLSKIE